MVWTETKVGQGCVKGRLKVCSRLCELSASINTLSSSGGWMARDMRV